MQKSSRRIIAFLIPIFLSANPAQSAEENDKPADNSSSSNAQNKRKQNADMEKLNLLLGTWTYTATHKKEARESTLGERKLCHGDQHQQEHSHNL